MANRSISSVTFKATLSGNVVNTMVDGATVAVAPITATITQSFTSGVSSGKANRGWLKKTATLADGADLTIDLYDFAGQDIGAGYGQDPVGQDMEPVEEIVVFILKNENSLTAAGQLEVNPEGALTWTAIGAHTVANGGALGGGGCLIKMDPGEDAFDVINASKQEIRLRAVGGDVTYSLWILARHDDDESSSSSSTSSSESTSSSWSSRSSESSSISTSSSSVTSSSSWSSTSRSSASSISTSSQSSSSTSSESSSSQSSSSLSTSSTSSTSNSSSSTSASSS